METKVQAPERPAMRDELVEQYGGDRNAWVTGWTPQAEIWNGRLAMIGFAAYLLWDLAGYSVVRDVLKIKR
jgi:hypothetical protein